MLLQSWLRKVKLNLMTNNRNFLFYGIGSIAFGIKGNAFSWFLFFYYNMVIGLPAWMASLALGIATIWDAFSDLLIGYSSDHTKSRFGRRHPYMYAALIPDPIFFYYLWNPPIFQTDINLFLYLSIKRNFTKEIMNSTPC